MGLVKLEKNVYRKKLNKEKVEVLDKDNSIANIKSQ